MCHTCPTRPTLQGLGTVHLVYWISNTLSVVPRCASMYVNVLLCTSMYFNVPQCTFSLYLDVCWISNNWTISSLYLNIHWCTSMCLDVHQCTSIYLNIPRCAGYQTVEPSLLCTSMWSLCSDCQLLYLNSHELHSGHSNGAIYQGSQARNIDL